MSVFSAHFDFRAAAKSLTSPLARLEQAMDYLESTDFFNDDRWDGPSFAQRFMWKRRIRSIMRNAGKASEENPLAVMKMLNRLEGWSDVVPFNDISNHHRDAILDHLDKTNPDHAFEARVNVLENGFGSYVSHRTKTVLPSLPGQVWAASRNYADKGLYEKAAQGFCCLMDYSDLNFDITKLALCLISVGEKVSDPRIVNRIRNQFSENFRSYAKMARLKPVLPEIISFMEKRPTPKP